jgi:hypothetical protein
MKNSKATYENRKKRPIGKICDKASRPDKSMFFEDSHFVTFMSQLTLQTLKSPTKHQTNQKLIKSANLAECININLESEL